ncbi:hypothetical protein BH23GEM7_BH23GEM7_28430 [soil metagenome]
MDRNRQQVRSPGVARRRRCVAALALAVAVAGACDQAADGQAVVGPLEPSLSATAQAEPEIFAPGVISTDQEEYRITFTPNGRTAYFGRAAQFFPVSRQATIYVTHLVRGRWTTPQVAPFSGEYSDIDPFITPDGSKLFFSSIRPVDGQPRLDADIWMVERTRTGWSEPIHLGNVVNSPNDDLYPSVARDGTLYFGSSRPGLPDYPRTWNIWRARWVDGEYMAAELLGEGVNSPTRWDFNPAISPDGRALAFTRLDIADQLGTGFGELHATYFHRGEWLPARNLGPPVNTPLDEYHPSFSPDGKYLYFARRNPLLADANGDLYRMPVRAIIGDRPPGGWLP